MFQRRNFGLLTNFKTHKEMSISARSHYSRTSLQDMAVRIAMNPKNVEILKKLFDVSK